MLYEDVLLEIPGQYLTSVGEGYFLNFLKIFDWNSN